MEIALAEPLMASYTENMSRKIVSASIVLDKSALEAYGFITDLDYYPYWSDIKHVEKVSGTGEVGSVYRLSKKTFVGKEEALVEVVHKVAPSHFAFRDQTKSHVSIFGFRIEDRGDQCLLTVYHEAQLNFFSGFLSANPITGVNNRFSLEELLKRIKAAF